jgi:hypothetical protein
VELVVGPPFQRIRGLSVRAIKPVNASMWHCASYVEDFIIHSESEMAPQLTLEADWLKGKFWPGPQLVPNALGCFVSV